MRFPIETQIRIICDIFLPMARFLTVWKNGVEKVLHMLALLLVKRSESIYNDVHALPS